MGDPHVVVVDDVGQVVRGETVRLQDDRVALDGVHVVRSLMMLIQLRPDTFIRYSVETTETGFGPNVLPNSTTEYSAEIE